ncbi:MAG TPA: hypothetical protein VE992_06720 [Solirubrobacteraceae bacterium]|nr:hypothetical protein [Solirubrobacteraceae bacterium]
MSRVRSLAIVLAVAAAGAGGAVAVASVTAASAATAPAKPARVAVGVEVLHFNAGGRRSTATGLVTAKLTDNTGATQTIRTKVAVVAATSGGCRILHLYLNQLNLVLLGLTVHLNKVVLDITGQRHGGVLGSLFCKLATAKVSSARAQAARALNRRMHGGQHVLRFRSYFTAKTAAAPGATCPVLDLVLGPLNLNLLGLVVNLNQVHLTITATNGGGALGDLFCQLAG